MNAAPRITRLGEDALLCFFTAPDDTVVPLPVQQRLWQLCRLLEAERESLRLCEIVPGMGNLLLRWNRPAGWLLLLWPSLPAARVRSTCCWSVCLPSGTKARQPCLPRAW